MNKYIATVLPLLVSFSTLVGGAPPAGDTQPEVSAEARKAELVLRKDAIDADLQALRERQKREVPAAARQALNEKLQVIAYNKGYGDPDRLLQVRYIKNFI